MKLQELIESREPQINGGFRGENVMSKKHLKVESLSTNLGTCSISLTPSETFSIFHISLSLYNNIEQHVNDS